nr:chorismate-binding protein [Bacteroidota bacterium]
MKPASIGSEPNTYMTDLQTLLAGFIKSGVPFVTYRKPGDREIFVMTFEPEGIQELVGYNQLNQQAGFVFHPYTATSREAALFLKPSTLLTIGQGDSGFNTGALNGTNKENGFPDYFPLPPDEIRNSYKWGLNEILSAIGRGEIQKAILSRTEFVPDYSVQQAPEMLVRLFDNYPAAFIYLLYLPGRMAWMGASPEILLERKGNNCRTIALAGTSVADHANSVTWTTKEIHEQQLVSDFIEGILNDFHFSDYRKYGPHTVQAGHLFHLGTDYEFDADPTVINFGKLASSLHPTPAVCGLPREQAMDIIRQVEKHDRGYYTGFIGPVNLNGESNLFVNLRCLQFVNNGLVIYTGGGITRGSDVDKEWEETVQKAQTLLSVLEKM